MKSLVAPVLIVLAGLLVYSNSLNGEFILDDPVAIQTNRTIRQLWPVTGVLFPPRDLMVEGSTVEGRPLLNLSFALNYAVGGTEVRGYHAANLGIHLVAALLLFGVVRRTLSLPLFRERMGHSATWLALVVAMVWVAHPLQTESVSYLSQRAESLAGMFYLLTMYLAIRSFASAKSSWWQAGAVAACVLGMATKEAMVTAPLLLWLYDWYFVGGSWKEVWRRRWKFYAYLTGLGWGTLACIMIATAGSNLGNVHALLSQLGGGGAGPSGAGHDVYWLDYARVQLWAIARYLRLSFWPHPLVFAYGRDMARGFLGVMPSALPVVLLLAATVWALRRRHWTGYLGAWYFLILAPTSSVVPLSGQTVAEHRMYLPLAAVAVLAVAAARLLWLKAMRSFAKNGIGGTRWETALAVFFVSLLLFLLGSETRARNADYRTAYSIWNDTVKKWPGNASAWNNRAMSLHELGRDEEAIVDYEKALEIDSSFATAYNGLGVVLEAKAEYAQAMSRFREALQYDPRNARAHNNLGNALLQKGQVEEAALEIKKALEIQPDYADAHYSLGNIFLRSGRKDECLAEFKEAIKIRPEFVEAHVGLGVVLFQTGRYDDGIREMRDALKQRPNFDEAHANLGLALVKTGQVDEGILHLERALALKPENFIARANLGMALL
ncbi:MAG TPA: tetratricopeptide repeat protein, partial [Verrucomicrobiaceae bacterium]